MKVVLFCGGFGMRLRDYSDTVPKPLVPIGERPILWHLMKYYAHYGHKEFILCLGFKGAAFKDYFLNYDECMSNDFVLSDGGSRIELIDSDIDDWRITFVDTGTASCVGERLKAVEPHLRGEEVFLANYSDGLSDVALPDLIHYHQQHESIATFLAVPPVDTFHAVTFDNNGVVNNIDWISRTDAWINAGFFVFRNEIFNYIDAGEDLVGKPFQRLIERRQLRAYRHNGFFCCMDTFKQKQQLDDMQNAGNTPWAVWKKPANGAARRTARSKNGSNRPLQKNS
jgi:glucose-1-phosphate cytidylyltransferase